MGTSGFMDGCCENPSLFKSMKIPDNIEKENKEINEIKTTESFDKNKNYKISQYEGFSPEELEKINEKININYSPYQKIPLKSSDINLIYKSGVIRSNTSNN